MSDAAEETIKVPADPPPLVPAKRARIMIAETRHPVIANPIERAESDLCIGNSSKVPP
jgi:hypothetical protein